MIRAREDRWFDRFRRTGDPRLLAKVFDRTAPELWRVAAHLCRDRHAAEDAVQSTFLAAIEARTSWDATRPLLPWLLGVLVRRVREQRRAAARSVDPARLPHREPADPAAVAADGEIVDACRAAIARVDEPYRATVEQHLLHERAPHEIAAQLGVPAGTVRMRLHRGLAQLRSKLPEGLATFGAAALPCSPAQFAAMRAQVLGRLPHGAAASATAAAASGSLVFGWLGVLTMKKGILAVAACAIALLGTFELAGWLPGVGAEALPPPITAVATTTRPIDAPKVQPVADASPREAVRTAPPAASKGRLRIVLRHGGTHEPIADLMLEAVAAMATAPKPGAPTPSLTSAAGGLHYVRTDEAGVATLDLPVGFASVQPSILRLANPLVAEITAGNETELVVDLPVRLQADVTVVDAHGAPVAGARIVGRTFADVGDFVERELGRTDALGHWTAGFLDDSLPVRALADGFVASAPADLRLREPRARLVLRAGPAEVAGLVLDASGRPMADTAVAIQPRPAGRPGVRPIAARTDAAGRYRCAYVPPGAITVFAVQREASGMRTARADATVPTGATTNVDVRFGSGGRVVVAMRGADGAPLVGANVNAVFWPEPDMDPHLASYTSRTTDVHGVATFDDLMVGTHEIQSFAGDARMTEKVVLAAGDERRIDWSLAPPTFVDVVVVDDADAPLADWQVALLPLPAGTLRVAQTDAQGRCHFADLPAQEYTVAVQRRGCPTSAKAAVRTGGATTVRVSAAAMPTAQVRGRATTSDPALLAQARAELRRMDAPQDGSIRCVLGADGAFHFDGLPAGGYLLEFRRVDDGGYLGVPQPVDVAAGAEVDLGAIELRAPGALTVAIRCSDGKPVAEPLVGLAMPQMRTFAFGFPPCAATEAGLQVAEMPAGRYELLAWGADIAPVVVPVAIGGPAQLVPITAERGVPTTFRIAGDGAAQLTLRQDGVELLRCVAVLRGPFTRGLLPGRYEVTCERATNPLAGPTATGATPIAFTVGREPGSAIELTLPK